MANITYVSGNYGKFVSVKDHFDKYNLPINFYEYDLEEPDINDIEIISKAKVMKAYELINKPCFVIDTGFYINDYPKNPGYPGAFVKRSGVSTNIDELLLKMKDVKNRNCKFIDCLTFYDGVDIHTFYGESRGTLSYEKKGNIALIAKSNLWYIFIPEGEYKTLSQMTHEEVKNLKVKEDSATRKFINWYKDSYK